MYHRKNTGNLVGGGSARPVSDTPELIAEFLNEAFETNDPVYITKGVGIAARSIASSSSAAMAPVISAPAAS